MSNWFTRVAVCGGGTGGAVGLAAGAVIALTAPVPPTSPIAKSLGPLPAKAPGQIRSGSAPMPTRLATTDDRLRCLARTIFFEARNQPNRGQVGVAAVVRTRQSQDRFPDKVCAVINQSLQFTWRVDDNPDYPQAPAYANRPDQRAWVRAQRIARLTLQGRLRDPTDGADHYHATYVDPAWGATMQRTAQLGTHTFYDRSQKGSVR